MDDRTCFVLMPFSTKYREIYEEVYKPVCETNRIKCWRVDEIGRPGSITRDIVEGILDADIIIADLSGKSPNVFYELGIAHSAGNKTIMTAQSKKDVPFDIVNYRVIFYEHTIMGCRQCIHALDVAIKELLQALDRTNNPVQEVTASRVVNRQKERVHLANYLNFSSIPFGGVEYLVNNAILHVDDLKRLDLEDMKKQSSIDARTLQEFIRQLMDTELDQYINGLHDFVIKNRINTGLRRFPIIK